MTLLIVGILLFAGVHFIPSLAPGIKATCINNMGEMGYKGIFSLLLLASFVLIVLGWRSIDPTMLYHAAPNLRQPAIALNMIAIGLLVVGSRNSRIRQGVRHPQLSGVLLWAVAHLMANGDTRSVILFTAMALWSFVEIVAISKREGDWVKSEVPSVGSEVITGVITVVLITVLLLVHPYMTGMPVLY